MFKKGPQDLLLRQIVRMKTSPTISLLATAFFLKLLPRYSTPQVTMFDPASTMWSAWIKVLFVVILWTLLNAVLLWQKRPKGIRVTGPTTILGKWISTLEFILRAPDKIRNAYDTSQNQELFAIPALRQYQVLVSHPQQIQELAASSPTTLSFNAAMTDRLFNQQTMFGFEFGGPDPHNSVANRAIKILLGTHLQHLMPKIRQRIVHGLETQLLDVKIGADGYQTLNITSFARAVAMRVNSQILFGDDLASNEEFQASCLRYSWDGGITAEISRQIPSLVAPIFGRAMMAWSGAMRRVAGHVGDLIDRRVLAEMQGKASQFLDVAQFVIRSSRTPQQKSRARLIQQMMALLFAISHQTPMALGWAVTMLGTHSEYIPLLREEMKRVEQEEGGPEIPLKKLRLMDSFLRETARLNPLDGLNTQRMALKAFTFSDGSHVPAGNLVAVPQHAVMRDDRIYSEPDRFDGHRFYTSNADVETSPSIKYTDVKWEFPYWGAPNHACPGRWYASDLQKLVLVHLIQNYELELVDPEVSSTPFVWTTALVPRLNAKIRVRAI